MSEQEKIELQCPHCSKNNLIHLSSIIECKHCNKSLIGHKYSKISSKIITAIALVSAIGGGVAIDKNLLRYPLSIEHAIIEACTTLDNGQIQKKDFLKKNKICLCALELTEKEYTYLEFKYNKNVVLEKFQKNTEICMKKQTIALPLH